MAATIRMVSPRIKKFHRGLVNRDSQAHDKPVPVLFIENGSDKILAEEPFSGETPDAQTQDFLQQFKGWCMPEQTNGYLKASHNDLL